MSLAKAFHKRDEAAHPSLFSFLHARTHINTRSPLLSQGLSLQSFLFFLNRRWAATTVFQKREEACFKNGDEIRFQKRDETRFKRRDRTRWQKRNEARFLKIWADESELAHKMDNLLDFVPFHSLEWNDLMAICLFDWQYSWIIDNLLDLLAIFLMYWQSSW